MSRTRLALMSAFTVVVLLGAVELASRFLFSMLEKRAFANRLEEGERRLATDQINFLKEPHGVYGYVLKPNVDNGSQFTNRAGYAQRDVVPVERGDGAFRLIAMGESTTHGHRIDTGNYPDHLRRILSERSSDGRRVEVLNAGVSGWASGQIALKAEFELAAFRPDVAFLYAGWNDFQGYDPFYPPQSQPAIEKMFGTDLFQEASHQLRTVALMDAAVGWVKWKVQHRLRKIAKKRGPADFAPVDTYRFYLHNLDRIVKAFRSANPETVIVASTIVGRWPTESLGDYESRWGRTYWMVEHEVSQEEAARRLAVFNQLIRDYAAANDIVMIDAAAFFADLDRSRLQTDFAHFTDEGYELLAQLIADSLERAAIIELEPNARLAQLTRAYERLPSVASGPPATR